MDFSFCLVFSIKLVTGKIQVSTKHFLSVSSVQVHCTLTQDCISVFENVVNFKTSDIQKKPFLSLCKFNKCMVKGNRTLLVCLCEKSHLF